MARFILEFNGGGKCNLCGEGTIENHMKKTIRLIEPASCTIVLTVCYLCVVINLLQTMSEDKTIQKDLMKNFYIKREGESE